MLLYASSGAVLIQTELTIPDHTSDLDLKPIHPIVASIGYPEAKKQFVNTRIPAETVSYGVPNLKLLIWRIYPLQI